MLKTNFFRRKYCINRLTQVCSKYETILGLEYFYLSL